MLSLLLNKNPWLSLEVVSHTLLWVFWSCSRQERVRREDRAPVKAVDGWMDVGWTATVTLLTCGENCSAEIELTDVFKTLVRYSVVSEQWGKGRYKQADHLFVFAFSKSSETVLKYRAYWRLTDCCVKNFPHLSNVLTFSLFLLVDSRNRRLSSVTVNYKPPWISVSYMLKIVFIYLRIWQCCIFCALVLHFKQPWPEDLRSKGEKICFQSSVMVLLDWEEATREPWEQVGDGWEVAVLLRIDYSSASHLVLIIFCLPLIIQRAWCSARNENPESQGLHLS